MGTYTIGGTALYTQMVIWTDCFFFEGFAHLRLRHRGVLVVLHVPRVVVGIRVGIVVRVGVLRVVLAVVLVDVHKLLLRLLRKRLSDAPENARQILRRRLLPVDLRENVADRIHQAFLVRLGHLASVLQRRFKVRRELIGIQHLGLGLL